MSGARNDESRGATFTESDIATLERTNAHTITFAIDFTAATSKAVKITIDGVGHRLDLAEHYRTQEHNPTPTVSKMRFARAGLPVGGAGNRFQVDNLTLTSS